MKCPKCGSELDTGFNCPNCGYKRYEVAVSKTELTTAEMLLWLVENVKAVCIFECDFGHLVLDWIYQEINSKYSQQTMK